MRDEFEKQWLGDLPDDWMEKRADFLCDPYRVVVDPSAFDDEVVAHYSIPQVQETGGPAIEPASDISSLKLWIKQPTILVSKLNPRKATVCIAEPHSDYPTLASSEFVSIRSNDFDQNYGYYFWCSAKVTDRLSALVQSATRSHQRVNPSDIKKLPWRWPPIETQRRIAAFLDEKAARIDGLIAKKRELLERLAEKRQALITHAVTKGLNADAPMKSSGIDWLGDIPAHWEVLPLRRIARKVSTGRTPPSSAPEYFDGDICWFTPGDFNGDISLQTSARMISVDAVGDGVASMYPAGTVYLVGIGATLGKVAVGECAGSANQQINAIQLEQGTNPYFLAYYLHVFRSEVRIASNGNTLGILNQDGTKSLLVIKAPATEQNAIADQLKRNDERQREAFRVVLKSIEQLAEYRSALITAAVTGQIAELK